MIIGFIAKYVKFKQVQRMNEYYQNIFSPFRGMQGKRIAKLEHQLSVNIHNTQHRIWSEVTKDLNYLRHVLNEVNFMKFKV